MAKGKERPQRPNLEQLQKPLHPVLRNLNKLDEMAARVQERKTAQEFKIDEIEEWRKIVGILASGEVGQVFLKAMVQHSGMFRTEDVNAQQMIESRIVSAFYRKWVRPFLSKELRLEIE